MLGVLLSHPVKRDWQGRAGLLEQVLRLSPVLIEIDARRRCHENSFLRRPVRQPVVR